MSDYKPGSFGVVSVKGPGGWWIKLGQALAGDASRYAHAFLILDEQGTLLEAEPGGARLANIREYDGCGMLISDGPVQQWFASGIRYNDEAKIRTVIVTEAHELVGTRYSWLDYVAIGLLHLNLPSKALRRYVASTRHMQCAQLVDAIYASAGIQLFNDGRQPGDVCPADLAAWAEDWAAKQ